MATRSADETVDTGVFGIHRTRSSHFTWRLVAGDGSVVATAGEEYATSQLCTLAIEKLIAVALDARIEDFSEERATNTIGWVSC